MEKHLDARFERVEKVLTTLIDSIAKYNPSEKLAENLSTADKDLLASLRSLEHHQNNAARIEALRQETAALDAQTKDIITTLWTIRKEVKNTTTTSYPSSGPKYQFTTSDLLSYARRISRNTLPPPGVTNGVDFGASPPATELPAPDGGSATQTPSASFNNGVGTPGAAATPGANGEVLASQATVTSQATELPMHLKPVVNPNEGSVFYAWPVEGDVRGGGLAGYQQLLDSGIDPKGYDPEEVERLKKEEERAKKEAEERARLEREEADRRMREERARLAGERERDRQLEAERRGSVAGESRPQANQQFSFLGMDDDDDDDE
ncbi:vitamin-D-receptor interacting mediator subunit 4-domain-containing protein [Podospora aff. communis PSN243]|uniref:Mediator of RNA polymerase II transcription subunit 4 n=1 Tax=Podospora aff. communis PSN243 TaxID=3040156 RepID=A0AAV9GPH7_9PEZI|nr:vitamin-D-receptor interacting mediator subunit 4-domain-containing protein [Podospora aff. communis PSN243]